MTGEALTAWWIAAARRQVASTPLDVKVRLLRHMIGDSASDATPTGRPPGAGRRVVLNAGASTAATEAVRKAGYEVRDVTFPLSIRRLPPRSGISIPITGPRWLSGSRQSSLRSARIQALC